MVQEDRGRTEYLLVGLMPGPAGLAAYPMGKGSGSVTTFSRADGFVIIPRLQEYVEHGERVRVRLLGRGNHARGAGGHRLALRRTRFLARSDGRTGNSLPDALGSGCAGRAGCGGPRRVRPCGEYTFSMPRATPTIRRFFPQTFVFFPVTAGCKVRLPEAIPCSRAARRPRRSTARGPGLLPHGQPQSGSGTRCLLDGLLAGRRPPGFAVEVRSHNAVASAVSQGRADWGVAIEPVARAYGLAFLPMRVERYDFAIPADRWDRPAVEAFRGLWDEIETRCRLAEIGFLSDEEERRSDLGRGSIVLCGGESRRMGQPKAWLPFGPERMLQRVVRLVSTVAGPIVVVAAPGQELPSLPEAVLVARDPHRGLGPLQGLAAGLAALPDEVELVYATATDVPFLQPAWIDRLVSLIADHDLAIPSCDGFCHPLAALYRRSSVLPACESLLQNGRLRPAFLMDILSARIVSADELRCEGSRPLDATELEHARRLQIGPGHGWNMKCPIQLEPALNRTLRASVWELFGVPRLRAGVSQLAVEAADIGEALRALSRACPSLLGSVLTSAGSLRPAYTLNINGQRFTSDPSTLLRDGDSLILLAVDVGG